VDSACKSAFELADKYMSKDWKGEAVLCYTNIARDLGVLDMILASSILGGAPNEGADSIFHLQS